MCILLPSSGANFFGQVGHASSAAQNVSGAPGCEAATS